MEMKYSETVAHLHPLLSHGIDISCLGKCGMTLERSYGSFVAVVKRKLQRAPVLLYCRH